MTLTSYEANQLLLQVRLAYVDRMHIQISFMNTHGSIATCGHPNIADEAWYWPEHVLLSGWFCITSRSIFRKMWFIDCSYMCSMSVNILHATSLCTYCIYNNMHINEVCNILSRRLPLVVASYTQHSQHIYVYKLLSAPVLERIFLFFYLENNHDITLLAVSSIYPRVTDTALK